MSSKGSKRALTQNRDRLTAAAEVFFILAECFKPPEKLFVEQLRCGQVDLQVHELFHLAGYDIEPIVLQAVTQEFQAMKTIYNRCLAGNFPPFILPVESLFKRWTEDRTAQVSIASSKGYLLGDSALHIQYLFKEFQLEVPSDYAQMPDHLALLLELLAYMLINRPTDECRDYLQDHFDWLSDLGDGIIQFEGSNFYSYALSVTQNAIQAELQYYLGAKGG